MLRSLRKNAQSWIIKGIFWIIVLAFVGTIFLVWGRGRDVAEEDIIAKVNDTIIPATTFYDEYNKLDQLYREVYGNLYDKMGVTKDALKQEALNSLINKVLLLRVARKMGIEVSDEEVMREISRNPLFQVNGQFNKERYLQVLSSNRLTPKGYESEMKNQLMLQKLTNFIQSTVKVSDSEVRNRYIALKREIRLTVVEIDPRKMKVEKPAPEEIAAYYAEHREEFRTPPAVGIVYALFSPEKFIGKVKVSDMEIKTFYEANQEKYLKPPARRFYELSINLKGGKTKSLEKMSKIRGEIVSGKITFADAVKKYTGKDRVMGPWVTKDSLPDIVAEEAFSLAVDGVTSPFAQGRKVKILKVAEIRGKEPYSLDEVRERVIEDLKRDKAKDLAIIKAYEAKGKISNGEPFEDTVKNYGLSLEKTGLVSSDTVEGDLKRLVSAAFMADVGSKPDVLRVNDNLYLFKVVQKKPSEIKPLNKVKKIIERKITNEKRMAAAKSKAFRIITDVKSGKTLDGVARKYGLKTKRTPYFSPLNSGSVPGLGPSRKIVQKVVVLSKTKKVLDEPLVVGNKVAIFEFGGEKKVSMKDFEKEKEKLAEIIFEKKKEEALQAFIREERKKAQIEISEEFKKI